MNEVFVWDAPAGESISTFEMPKETDRQINSFIC
jgi:hypothetical protein